MAHEEQPKFPWHIGVFDAHCHPTDTMATVSEIPKMNATALTIMSTRAQDQDLVANVAEEQGLQHKANDVESSLSRWQGVVPSFGWHPWFSHHLYDDLGNSNVAPLDNESKISHYEAVLTPTSEDRDFLRALPDPVPLSKFLEETRHRLAKHNGALIGEVGLDRGFRLPQPWVSEEHDSRDDSLTPGGREGRRLSPYKVQMDHQRKILKAQLSLAAEMQRAVSIHGVQAHGLLFDTISETWKGQERKVLSKREQKRRGSVADAHRNETMQGATDRDEAPTFPPRICLHSYSGPAETLKQYLHPTVPVDVYVSFSTVINFSTSASAKTEDVIRAVPEDRILIESDMHTAGSIMDENLEAIARKICSLKGWDLSEGLTQLSRNWKSFIFGSMHYVI